MRRAIELLNEISSTSMPGQIHRFFMSREEIDRLYPRKPSEDVVKKAYNFRRKDGTIDIL